VSTASVEHITLQPGAGHMRGLQSLDSVLVESSAGWDCDSEETKVDEDDWVESLESVSMLERSSIMRRWRFEDLY
jgi:hypothetical protein